MLVALRSRFGRAVAEEVWEKELGRGDGDLAADGKEE
jgi:hypothetical protein